MKKNIFVVGAKGMGNYGGYETFIDKLTECHQNDTKIKYHVAWKSDNFNEFEKNGARCFNVKVPNIGPAQAIYYDVKALSMCCKYIKENNIKDFIVYILACRIGPFMNHYVKKVHKLGGKVYVNPDGHEWMRAKWSVPVRKYWKISEQLMVKCADLLVCDSINIEKYIKETYAKYNPNTTFIAYGAETRKSTLKDDDEKLINWYKEKGLKSKEYYLVVGRFVPENNYETMIKEFMKSNTKKDFAIITNVNNKFLNELEEKLHFRSDSRIKFVGTVYDKELIMKIRENAYGYFHGHEVGGTNPSLLEALGSTNLNLLLDVGFNREVGEDAAIYWSKEDGNLASLIKKADKLSDKEIKELGKKAKKRIQDTYSWQYISEEYKKCFMEGGNKMKIIHYFLGFPPYRTGGLTKYVMDLMEEQKKDENEVIAIWPGKIKPFNKKIKLKKKKINNEIINYELINPLPVPLDEGINDINAYTKKGDIDYFDEFLENINPDVIHVHTLMGLYKEFINSAIKKNIKTVFTTHDYFGICPRVTLFKNNIAACDNDNNCIDCVECNVNALSINKIMVLQSPLYRILKGTKIVKFLRRKHRNNFCKQKKVVNTKGKTNEQYLKLRDYYVSILESFDMVHYNSFLTKNIYERYIKPKSSIVLNITHKNIRNCKGKLNYKINKKIKLVYLSPAKTYKGFDIIKKGLDELWASGYKNFELNLYGKFDEVSPYMNIVAESFDNSKLDEVFKDIDLLLAPSVWYETFGFTVLEALSYGVPVLISENVGAKDIVKNGGIIIKPNNVEDLKNAIRELNSSKIKLMRENIKNNKIKNWEEFVKENYKLYE